MKTSLLATLLALLLFAESRCQDIGYFLPEKKLRVTVTYQLNGYALQRLSGDQQEILDRRFEVTIAEDIQVEEVIVPDRNRYFQLSLPQQLQKGGARFGWSLKLDRNGILTGWNASREPIAAAVISGGIGLIANLLTGFTGLQGVLPVPSEAAYKVVTTQKITVTEIVDIPAGGISGKVVAVPQLDTVVTNALVEMPSVSISVTDMSTGTPASKDETTNSTDVLYYIAPKHYRLLVTVNANGLVENAHVIDHILLVPQHGQLKRIAISELFKGRKSASISVDPTTGQLLTWQYTRDGSTKTDFAEINKQLESLNKSISGVMTTQHQKLKQEVARLELEAEKRELKQKLQD